MLLNNVLRRVPFYPVGIHISQYLNLMFGTTILLRANAIYYIQHIYYKIPYVIQFFTMVFFLSKLNLLCITFYEIFLTAVINMSLYSHGAAKPRLHRVKTKTIMKTRLYNSDPLEPHFHIVKLGFTGVYIIFHLNIFVFSAVKFTMNLYRCFRNAMQIYFYLQPAIFLV